MTSKTFARGSSVRRAFTLIELLVVIVIIGLMTGLIVAGAMKFKDSQVTATTDALVTRHQSSLDTDYKQVVEKCQREPVPADILAWAGNDVDRARAVHTAATIRMNFPETFAEATATFDIGGRLYRPKSTFASVAGVSGTPEQERAILLYFILKERTTGGGTGDDTGSPGEQRVVTLGTKSFTHFIDLHGMPLVYYRWLQNTELNAPPFTTATPVSRDPLDPKNLVAGWTDAAKLAHLKSSATNGTLPNLVFNAQNRVATVVSFGKNKQDNGAVLGSDDRVGYRLARFGAKGDGK